MSFRLNQNSLPPSRLRRTSSFNKTRRTMKKAHSGMDGVHTNTQNPWRTSENAFAISGSGSGCGCNCKTPPWFNIYRLIPSFWQRHKNFDYFSGSFHLWHVGPMPHGQWEWWWWQWWAANGVPAIRILRQDSRDCQRRGWERIFRCWTRTAPKDIMQFVSVLSYGERLIHIMRTAKAVPMQSVQDQTIETWHERIWTTERNFM